MKEHPILFSGPMVRAILDGSKTQTRRVVESQPHEGIGEFIDLGAITGHSGCGPWKPSWAEMPPVGEAVGYNSCLTCPYGWPGSSLWVREQMRVIGRRSTGGKWTGVKVRYEADGAETDWIEYPPRLKWEIEFDQCLPRGGHREASRLTLKIVSVRVERLQSISKADAIAEGVPDFFHGTYGYVDDLPPAVANYRRLWDELNAKRGFGWDANCWVWCLSFRRVMA